MKKFLGQVIFCWVCMIAGNEVIAQTTVGMGTGQPNPNAVLELVSEEMNQGFLVPRFTSNQRNASGFTTKLTNKDNGLLVFDTDDGKFYYWHNGGWQQGFGTGSTETSGTVWYTGNGKPRNNEGKNGDFYIHTPSGEVFRKQLGAYESIGNMSPATLDNGKLFVGNASNVPTQVNINGDATLANDGKLTIKGLQGDPVATTSPSSGNVLTWNGAAWEAQPISGGGGGNGASWYEGLALPGLVNPVGAINGDYYYRTDTEIIYKKVLGVWLEQGKFFKPPSIVQDPNTIVTDVRTPTIFVGPDKPADGFGEFGDMFHAVEGGKQTIFIKSRNGKWIEIK